MKTRVTLIFIAVVMLAVIGYGSYQLLAFENLKNACITKEMAKGKMIGVYFEPATDEGLLPPLATKLGDMENVENAKIVSSSEALVAFKERHANDSLTLQALNQLGTNPLGPSITIMFKDLRTLADNEGIVVSEITAYVSAQGLRPASSIVSKASTSEKSIESLRNTNLFGAVLNGSYPYEIKLLTGCAAEAVSSN